MFKIKSIKDKSIKQIIKDYWIYYILAVFLYGSVGIIAHYLTVDNEFLGMMILIIMITPLYVLGTNIIFENKAKNNDTFNDTNIGNEHKSILKDLGYSGRKISLFIKNNKNPKIIMLYEELHDYIYQLNSIYHKEEKIKITSDIVNCIYGILRGYDIDYELLENVLKECRTTMQPWHKKEHLMTIEDIKNNYGITS